LAIRVRLEIQGRIRELALLELALLAMRAPDWALLATPRNAGRRPANALQEPKSRASTVAGGATDTAMRDRATASATALMTESRWSIAPIRVFAVW
jgi:hypothetical protein